MKFLTSLLLAFCLMMTAGCIKEKDDSESQAMINVSDAYSFATLPGMATGAGFMVIENLAQQDDTLISVSSPVAEINEIHQNHLDPDDGTMMMRRLTSVDVPAGGKVDFDPKGYHIMMIKLKEPLTIGRNVPVTLSFKNAGDILVDMTVISPGTTFDHTGHH
ncbi:MAG: copper chaperone PCu(A)C [Alphaproteobacteria bacterium]|nr:copper chaperone PCu(A)C [Alphaproteobacteria bacterium]